MTDPFASHDDAGDLVVLRGGPKDDFRAREGAPWLEPDYWPDGRYVPSGQQQEGLDVWTWEPA